MPDPAEFVHREVRAIQALIDQAGDDKKALLRALDAITALHTAVQDARQFIADVGPPTVTRALQAGVDPDMLRGRPYTESQVRKFAREAGLPPKKRGPRRRELPPAAK